MWNLALGASYAFAAHAAVRVATLYEVDRDEVAHKDCLPEPL